MLGLGLDTIDHFEPFHRSIRVAKLDEPLDEPAAQQFVALVQVMACRKVVVNPDGDGALTSEDLLVNPSVKMASRSSSGTPGPLSRTLISRSHSAGTAVSSTQRGSGSAPPTGHAARTAGRAGA